MTTRLFHGLIVSALLALNSPLSTSRVLDDFNDNAKTAWQDFTFVSGLGLPTESDGQFKFNLPPAGQALFTASTKTSETFTIEDGVTVEFRVDLVSGNGPDAFAVLAFIPVTSSVDTLAGYGFAKSESDVLVTKGIQKYFYNENPDTPLKNENVIMSLSLTGRGSDVVITARLLDKDDNNAVLFEETFVDTPGAEILADGEDDPAAPYLGAGNFVLMCYEDFDEDAPQASYEVTFDNAEVFVLQEVLVDDFDDNNKTGWEDFTFVEGFGLPVEENGQFKFELPPAGQALFVASTKTSPVFELKEGEKLRFQVDVLDGVGADSFAVLAFIPSSSSASSLAGYGFAQSATDVLITKGIQKYFYNEHVVPELKNTNVTLVLTLEAREGDVIINGQILDKDDNNAVIFDQTFIDTPGADILADGDDDPATPFIGAGNFVLYCYEDFSESNPQEVYRVIFDNAIAATPPLPGNSRPVISNLSPAPFANFVPATGTVSFTVTDDKELAAEDIRIVLNGETFDSESGLVISGEGNTRTASLDGLEANINYIATLSATDSDGETVTMPLLFDTFLTENLVIEVEDYNFGAGLFYDNPNPYPEGTGPYGDGYVSQWGTATIDYMDAETGSTDAPYRPNDIVAMRRSLDHPREKFTDAGGTAAMVYDYDVGEIEAGEWLNYTRTFPAGTYEVYLRESLVNGTQIETLLERVTSEPFFEDQTTQVLGSFLTPTTGFLYRNVPLTDALGQNKVLLNLAGETTLRITQASGAPADGDIFQNYLVFIPVEEGGVQRANVASVSPASGATVTSLAPSISATIQNRETDVESDSIRLYVNDELVEAAVTETPTGATVAYPLDPLPAPGTTVTARLEFDDSGGVNLQNAWSFTLNYLYLNPANRRVGEGTEGGLNLRLVQAPAGSALENTLARAEDQLTANSSIPKEIDATTTVEVVNFVEAAGNTRGEIPGDILVPGLQPETNGTDDYVVEITGYLDLAAGIHRFGIITDDGYKIQSGSSLTDRTALPLEFVNGATANETFEFYVAESGLYPFRLVWYERGGDSHAEWTSINRETGERILINDPDHPDAVKAYLNFESTGAFVQVESSATVDGTFAIEPSATIDEGAKTITIPLGSGNRFFRLSGASGLQLLNPEISGDDLVLGYE